jgi:predicted dinucleotide-binding enzyme
VPGGTPKRIALPIAGADGAGRDVVHGIVDQLGFEPVDAGPISESWRQQPGTPVYGKDFGAEDTVKALAEATPERTAEWSARGA